METVILADDVNVGDVIILPRTEDPVRVNMVRFSQGRLVFTVTADDSESPERDQPVKLTAEVRLCSRAD